MDPSNMSPQHEKRRLHDLEDGLAVQDVPRKPVSRPHSRLPELVTVIVLFLIGTAFFQPDLLDDVLSPIFNEPELEPPISHWNISYEAVPGYFKQDKSNANATKIGPAPDRFGLIDHSGKYWKKFEKKVAKLNKKARKHRKDGQATAFKVLFIGRHGEGYHNVGMDYYGEEEWDKKWGRMYGNGTITWGPDAQLTPKGVSQAERVHSLWKQELHSGGGIPLPTKLYVSPLSRALHTFQITFAGIVDDPPPTIVEDLRDAYGLRTADLRHNKTWIHQAYPSYVFEEGFTEHDELWVEGERESDDHVEQRVGKVLDRILKTKDTYLAIVAHSKTVEATFKVVNHQEFDVPTGGVVPILLNITYTKL